MRQAHRPLILLRKSWSMKLITECVMSAPFPFIILLNCHLVFNNSFILSNVHCLVFSHPFSFHSKHDERYIPSLAKMGPQESWDSHADCGEVAGAVGHTGNVLLDLPCLQLILSKSSHWMYRFHWNLAIHWFGQNIGLSLVKWCQNLLLSFTNQVFSI